MRNISMRKHVGDDLEWLKQPGSRRVKWQHIAPFWRYQLDSNEYDDIDDQQMFYYTGQWHHRATGSRKL